MTLYSAVIIFGFLTSHCVFIFLAVFIFWKIGRPRKTWMEGVQAAMTTRNLEPDQWRNRDEWRLVSGRRRQLFKKTDRLIDFLVILNSFTLPIN